MILSWIKGIRHVRERSRGAWCGNGIGRRLVRKDGLVMVWLYLVVEVLLVVCRLSLLLFCLLRLLERVVIFVVVAHLIILL